jgi:small subunit ribosomal protein S17
MTTTEKKVTKNPVVAVVASVSKDGSTAKVEVERIVENKVYGKRLRRISVYHVDTAGFQVAAGDKVRMLPCRRMSKTKSWKVLEVASVKS